MASSNTELANLALLARLRLSSEAIAHSKSAHFARSAMAHQSTGRSTAPKGVRARIQQMGSGVGGARRDRTDDLLLAKQALSQLSYGPFGSKAERSQRSEARRRSALLDSAFWLPVS